MTTPIAATPGFVESVQHILNAALPDTSVSMLTNLRNEANAQRKFKFAQLIDRSLLGMFNGAAEQLDVLRWGTARSLNRIAQTATMEAQRILENFGPEAGNDATTLIAQKLINLAEAARAQQRGMYVWDSDEQKWRDGEGNTTHNLFAALYGTGAPATAALLSVESKLREFATEPHAVALQIANQVKETLDELYDTCTNQEDIGSARSDPTVQFTTDYVRTSDGTCYNIVDVKRAFDQAQTIPDANHSPSNYNDPLWRTEGDFQRLVRVADVNKFASILSNEEV